MDNFTISETWMQGTTEQDKDIQENIAKAASSFLMYKIGR